MATKRLRPKIYAMEDVEKHNNEQSCWVTYQGGVYDVTSLVSHSLPSIAFLSSSNTDSLCSGHICSFVGDHPGGDEFVLEYAGKDVEDIMNEPESHSHSDSAFDLLRDWQIGVLGGEETTW